MIIQVKNYSKREELENEIGKLVGKTPDIKIDYEIKGTREELERLHLSDETMVFGIKCVITDTPTMVKTQKDIPKINRGIIKKYGINIKNNQ